MNVEKVPLVKKPVERLNCNIVSSYGSILVSHKLPACNGLMSAAFNDVHSEPLY